MGLRERGGVGVDERRTAGHPLPGEHPEGVEVGGRVAGPADGVELLGGHVGGGPGAGAPAGVELGEAEVGDADPGAGPDRIGGAGPEQVAWLEVPVDDPRRVGGGQRVEQRAGLRPVGGGLAARVPPPKRSMANQGEPAGRPAVATSSTPWSYTPTTPGWSRRAMARTSISNCRTAAGPSRSDRISLIATGRRSSTCSASVVPRVAEELGVDEGLGDGGGVAGDQRSAGARGEPVERGGDQLLARAAGPAHPHVRGAVGHERDLVAQGPGGGRLADEAEPVGLAEGGRGQRRGAGGRGRQARGALHHQEDRGAAELQHVSGAHLALGGGLSVDLEGATADVLDEETAVPDEPKLLPRDVRGAQGSGGLIRARSLPQPLAVGETVGPVGRPAQAQLGPSTVGGQRSDLADPVRLVAAPRQRERRTSASRRTPLLLGLGVQAHGERRVHAAGLAPVVLGAGRVGGHPAAPATRPPGRRRGAREILRRGPAYRSLTRRGSPRPAPPTPPPPAGRGAGPGG